MSQEAVDALQWITVQDSKDGVIGVAVVKKGFRAELHWHAEEEVYEFLEG
jgi:hypothetical protein